MKKRRGQTIYTRLTKAGITQSAECQLPKLNVAGSIPVARSIFFMLVLMLFASPSADTGEGYSDIWAIRSGYEPSSSADAVSWRLHLYCLLDEGLEEEPDLAAMIRNLKAGDTYALVTIVTELVRNGQLSDARAFMEGRGYFVPATRRDLAVALAWYGRFEILDVLDYRSDPPPDLEGDTYEAQISTMLFMGWMETSPDGLFHGDNLAGSREVELAASGLLGIPVEWSRDWIAISELDILFVSGTVEGDTSR